MQLHKDAFLPLDRSEQAEHNDKCRHTGRQTAWHRLKKNKMAMLGLCTIILLFVLAIFVPWFSGISYSAQNLAITNQAPSAEHWFGTDNLGRDIWIRVLYGARISLAVGVVASLINLTIGVIYGGIAGLIGGRVDKIMMKIVDI